MSYDMGGGAGGGNQKSKKYKPRSFGERQGANSGYPVRPGQPGKYSHDPTISTGVIERQISPKLQLGQAPPHGVGEDVQKQEGTVGGSGGTDTVGVPIPPSGIDISNLLSKAVHVPDFTTIISKCTGSLYTPEIEQPPVVQPAVVKLELEPLDEKLPPQEQPSTNPDTRSQQWQQLIPDQQQQKHQLLQHHPSSRDINQHHILQHQQGEHPNHGQSHQQHPPQQQSASIEWTAPPSHLVQEPRAALQNQQQPVSSWDGTSVIPSQPVTPPPHQSQWIRSNVASQQQPQLNDAKGHPTDKGNQQQNAGWGSATNIRAAGSEFMYENEVPSSQPTGRSEQHQQQLQNPTPITWGHQPAQAHRLAPQQQYPSPHQPMEPTMEQLSSSQQAPSPSVVHVRHLLVKYCGSRNPTSLKDPTGEKIRQRSIEEAMETLKRLRVEAIGGSEANFADLATQWSDCNSSKRGGDLGAFGRGKMQPPFEAVAFDLPVGMVAHYYMDAELQGTLSMLKWPHMVIADSLKMGDAAVEMADKGVKHITCMGVDFMAESVRAALDATGHKNIPVYRLSSNEIGCSLADSAEKMAYEAWLRKAARSEAGPNLHVVYINTSLVSKAMAESIIPTITCTSSNVLQTVLQAFAQIPDLTIWYGPDTYMGENLETMLRGMCNGMTDSDIRTVHSQHNRSTISEILDSGRFQYFKQGCCIVHHMFGDEVVSQLRRNYGDAFHLAHLEVPGEMFSLALEFSRQGRGIVGSTSNILNFIMNKAETMEEGKHAQFILGTESGMITSIVRAVQEKLKAQSSKTNRSSPTEVEIVFPVASEAMSIAEGGTGPLATVPGVSGGEGCSTAGGCATCPFMKMNDLQGLFNLLNLVEDGRENELVVGQKE